MKTLQFLRTLATAALLVGTPVPLLAQGPLNPSGPPAPMMKTLVEMEPRTHIVSLPYTITASGSYYLTTNLSGGGTAAGIIIQASGVTIDLRGFSIENCTSGISPSGTGVKDVAIHNGIVRGCTGSGIDLGSVGKVRLENVMVYDNGGDGASVGETSSVTLCTAKGNTAHGIALASGGKVFQCVSQANGGSGIAVTSSCQVADNNCNSNGSGAGLLTAGTGNRVEGNSSNQNKYGFLINGTANLVIRNNACSNTTSDYSVSAGNNYGQVLVSPGAAFASSNAWANFGCGTPTNPGCATAIDCDDSDACTTDVCQASVCSHTPIPDCGGTGGCTTDSQCNDGNACTIDVCIAGICSVGGPSVCNDGDACTTDACDPINGCMYAPIPDCGAACGDGIVQAGESCDDANLTNGDGCSAVCTVQTGYTCAGSPSVCTSLCGDGIVTGTESCDDANNANGDGCSATCSVESDYTCAGAPSVCTPITYPLIATKAGTGSGTVTSTPAGITCGADCSESYSSGTLVSLAATSATGSTFSGWSGACTGTGSCTVTMNAAKSVTATFSLNTYTLSVTRAGAGSGTVTSTPAGINCGADCSESYPSSTDVTLTAVSATGSSFAGWSGDCTGTGTCTVSMTSAKSVTATFNP